jgi:hypothetical protein
VNIKKKYNAVVVVLLKDVIHHSGHYINVEDFIVLIQGRRIIMRVRLKLKDNVNLKEFLKGFVENEYTYDLDSPFDEYISINKSTREISQYGYMGLLYTWADNGLIENIN